MLICVDYCFGLIIYIKLYDWKCVSGGIHSNGLFYYFPVTVEVNVSFEDNFESKYYLQGFVSKLNTINSYAGSKQKKVGEVISWLKDSNTEILESVQLNNLSILIWICCWSEDGLDRMKSMAESGELLSQFNKLFECLTYLSRQIKPTYVHLDDAQLKYKKKGTLYYRQYIILCIFYFMQCYFQLSPVGIPPESQTPSPQKNTQNTENIKNAWNLPPPLPPRYVSPPEPGV